MLSIDHVTKRFDGVVAVDDLTFSIPEGGIFGFLGPNGAGKTTTMRMILDIIRPDTGHISWQGKPIGAEERKRFGYLPEERGLYQKMKVREQLVFFARLYGLDARAASERVGEWLARFGIAERQNSRLDELSRGNQQKVQVIAALLHEPDLALLDEPFTGLDPINGELLEDCLRELRDAGKTVVLSSHRMEQVEELCDEVAIISRGRLKLTGNVGEIRDGAVRRVIDVRTVSGRVASAEQLGLKPLAPARGYLRFALEPGVDPQDVLSGLLQGETVELFALERPSLQEIFVEAVKEDDEDEWDARTSGSARE
jgi:ABC-2 type transport system ATP-binding protein